MSTTRGQDIWAPGAWHSGAPYSPGLRHGQMLFLSGAVPIDRATGDTVGESIEEQTSQTIDNLAAILGEAGGTLDDVVKSTVFLTDSTLAAGMNSVYSQRFTAPYPARSTVQVGPLARVEFLIEIEAIAILDDDR